MSRLLAFLAFLLLSPSCNAQPNSTYYNPVIPGWASDPSCTQVDGIFYCVLSTFVAFPGLPIYASADLINWKLISHAWNRDSQLPDISLHAVDEQNGMYAANLRHQNGTFYCTCTYLGDHGSTGTIFQTNNPYSDTAWSNPLLYNGSAIDPDLFFDDDGTVYITSAGMISQTVDLSTGNVSKPVSIWNGTGGVYPEGPHVYKKDGWYYLMVGEGGTELNHMETIARSKNILGPYEAGPHNPILSNANTTEWFQTVGHADLFQDTEGNWWGMALTTRSGPDWKIYPMGRETALFPVTWNEGEWPVVTQVRGIMNGWPLPPTNRSLPFGMSDVFQADPDVIDFEAGSSLPAHFYRWRYPKSENAAGVFEVSPPERPNTLKVTPGQANLTGIRKPSATEELSGLHGIPFIGRKQTHTEFLFSVDIEYAPTTPNHEAGISVFLTQMDHLDLGIVLKKGESEKLVPHLLLSKWAEWSEINTAMNYTRFEPELSYTPIPESWRTSNTTLKKIRLAVHAPNPKTFTFTAYPADNPNARIILGSAEAERLSGHSGRFTGVLLGVYATTNGGVDKEGGEAYFSRWRYTGVGQHITEEDIVPAVDW